MQDIVRLSVEIPKELHVALKMQAIKEGRNSLKDLIISICTDYLKKNK